MKSKTPVNTELFRSHQTHSPEEVLAAGGTTAFALKTGKNNNAMIKTLKSTPLIEPFTPDEWDDLMSQLD